MTWWSSLGLPGTQVDKESIKFPYELELVPDVLRASVVLSRFSLAGEEMICWTYVSDGLKKVGQKELLISIKKSDEEKNSDFPQAPVEFFKTVFQHSIRKEFINIGSISEFGDVGFLSDDFPAATYVNSQTLGDWFPPENSLATVLLTREELKASNYVGVSRIASLLGKSSMHFPCPVWNDLARKSVVDDKLLAVMEESFVAQMPRILIRDSGVSAADKVIDLQLPLSARHFFTQLSELAVDSALLLLLDFDERADAVLVFQQDKDAAPLAISAPGLQGNRVAGSFICFAPAQSDDHGMIIEDGFAISLKAETWEELRHSLVNGSPFYLPRQRDGYDFRLAWHQDEIAAIGPDTIEIHGVELGCHSAISKAETDGKTTVPAYATEINLLTHEKEIRSLIELDVLRRYIQHVEDIVRDHFMCMGESDGFKLQLNCTILPERLADFEVSSSPVMEAEDEVDLLDRLSITYAPQINEKSVKFNMVFSVWGGKELGTAK